MGGTGRNLLSALCHALHRARVSGGGSLLARLTCNQRWREKWRELSSLIEDLPNGPKH